MDGLSFYNFLDELNNDFSLENIEGFVHEIGLENGQNGCEEYDFGKYIFLQGSQDEVYSKKERKFIEEIGSVYVFPDQIKTTRKGNNVPCRLIAADMYDTVDELFKAILFMKLVIKAFGGFTVFIIRLSDGIHLGGRVLDGEKDRNCTLCEADRLSLIVNEAQWDCSCDDFLEYYSGIKDSISPLKADYVNYDEMATKRRGAQSSYIQSMMEIEEYTGESTHDEIDRYNDYFDDENETCSFATQVDDYNDELSDIVSSKVNSLEMLFEAEEMAEMSSEPAYIQETFDFIYDEPSEADRDLISDNNGDPEAIINMLKMKKGLM